MICSGGRRRSRPRAKPDNSKTGGLFPMTLSTTQSAPSRIAQRTRGQTHGPVTRLMPPADFGQLLKPFVFLDLFDNHGKPVSGLGLHPRSGIATLTYVMESNVR